MFCNECSEFRAPLQYLNYRPERVCSECFHTLQKGMFCSAESYHSSFMLRTIFNVLSMTGSGYWHRRADERYGNPPQGYQDLLVVRDKVGRPPGELGVSKSMECDIFPSVLWHCWLSDRKVIRPVEKQMLVCWWWWFDWSSARLSSSPVVTTTIILCFRKYWLTQIKNHKAWELFEMKRSETWDN